FRRQEFGRRTGFGQRIGVARQIARCGPQEREPRNHAWADEKYDTASARRSARRRRLFLLGQRGLLGMVTRLHALAVSISLAAGVLATAASADDLGKNLAGESCRSAGPLALAQQVSIRCGDAGQTEAGDVTAFPAPQDKTTWHNALAQLAHTPRQDLNCQEPQWTASGRVAVRICSLKSNGWPRIMLAAESGGHFYLAEGTPSALPAIQAAIAQDSREAQTPGESKAVTAIVEAKLSADAVRSSASDYENYRKFIEAARLAGAADNYAAAEANYRQALGIEQRLFGERSDVVGQTLAELALQVSNQGRFVDAAALFRRAGPLIEASSVDSVRARYDSYLALNAAN